MSIPCLSTNTSYNVAVQHDLWVNAPPSHSYDECKEALHDENHDKNHDEYQHEYQHEQHSYDTWIIFVVISMVEQLTLHLHLSKASGLPQCFGHCPTNHAPDAMPHV